MTPSSTLGQQMERVQRNVLFVGLIALLVSLIGLFTNAAHFWQSYLFAYVFSAAWASFSCTTWWGGIGAWQSAA